MASSYYLPQGLLTFKSWNTNFQTKISATPTVYGLTAGEATDHGNLTDDFDGALIISNTPSTRTPVSVAATNTAFELVRASAQFLVQKYQASGLATEVLSSDINVTFRDEVKTPITAPTAVPDISIERIDPQLITLRIKQLGAIGNALPLGSIGYEVYGAIGLTNPPNSPSAMVFVVNGSRRFISIPFDTMDIGKNVSFAIRYRTAKNLTGPWSSIITCTVSAG